MPIEQLIVAIVFFATIGALVFTNRHPAGIFGACTLVLLLAQQVSFDNVLDNMTNMGLITLVLLLLVSNSIDKTAFIKRLGRAIVTKSYRLSFIKMFFVTFFSSALLNNTAVVASLIGPIKQNTLHAPSRLLIPLSYAAILGGTVTLIGTSTNLIVDSFLIEHGHEGFAFFDFTLFGISAGILCAILLFLMTPLLPKMDASKNNYASYLVEADVEADSELIGKSVEQNHLRNLPELFLIEVVRNNRVISPVFPNFIIQENDKLIFTGNVKKLDSIEHIKGLTLFAEADGLLSEDLTEVIVSNRATLINKSLKQVSFRAVYDAAVVAIRRDGAAISGKLGDLKLQAGDFLILATGEDFQRRDALNKNFFIVNEQKITRKLLPWQEYFTLCGFLLTVILAAMSLVPLAIGLLFFAAALIAANVSTMADLKRNLPLNLIFVIVGALSLATALENSGIIASMTDTIGPILEGLPPIWALACVYLMTVLLTEFVTNNAAAALMFPFAFGLVGALGLPIMPFALAVAFAASASFISPYGYQTNLIVFSASDYKFSHFIKMGTPISILYGSVVLTLLNIVYL